MAADASSRVGDSFLYALRQDSRLEAAPWTVVRWLPLHLTEPDLDALSLPTGSRIAYDMGQNPVVLFANDWSANYFAQTNPKVALSLLPAPGR